MRSQHDPSESSGSAKYGSPGSSDALDFIEHEARAWLEGCAQQFKTGDDVRLKAVDQAEMKLVERRWEFAGRPVRQVKGFGFVVLRNAIYREGERSTKRRKAHQRFIEEVLHKAHDRPRTLPEELGSRVLEEEQTKAIRDAIDTLSHSDRELAMARYMRGLTVEELADEQGVSSSTISRWFNESVLPRLRHALDGHDGFEIPDELPRKPD